MEKALRIILKQSSANYKKEETDVNKMTYPLPPVSTVIGAIHSACDYEEYHPMDISIQGRYESMHREPYTDYCFLNSVQDDRGILVKMKNNSLLSNAFDKVASAKKTQGNSFVKGITIQIYNEELMKEYRELKLLPEKIKNYKNTEYKEKISGYKEEKARLAKSKKIFDKKSDEYKEIVLKEKKIKEEENEYKEKLKQWEVLNYKEPISKFKSLTTSLKYYEILNNIELVLHIRANEETLKNIKENIYNLKSIGRSEDFVDVVDCQEIELYKTDDCYVESEYSAYLNYKDVLDEKVFTKSKGSSSINGTKYYINKNYEIVDGKRIFEKKKVIYASNYFIEETSEKIYIDKDSNKEYIVNFI